MRFEAIGIPKASPCRLCYWGGGADTGQARGDIMAAQNAATGAIREMFGVSRGVLAPWSEQTGPAAARQIGGLLNLPGFTALDPTATLTGTPGYNFLADRGANMLARYGAATGQTGSGAAMRGATNYGQQLAQTYAWQPYMSALQNLSGQGLSGAGSLAGAATSAGSNLANTYMWGGQNLANLDIQQANAQNAGMSDLFGGLGFMGSLIAAPFTGGASLAGAIPSIMDWFGNATGSYMPATQGSGLPMNFANAYGAANPYAAFNVGYGGGDMSFYPLMAEGGALPAGQPAIVGERGPELFVPQSAGTVIPNRALPRYDYNFGNVGEPGRRGPDYPDEMGADFSDLVKFGALYDFGAGRRHRIVTSYGDVESPY